MLAGCGAQRFSFRAAGSVRFEDLWVDVADGTPVTHASLQLWPCKPTAPNLRSNQTSLYRGAVRSGDRCLQMPATAASPAPAALAACDDSAGQIWDVHLGRLGLKP